MVKKKCMFLTNKNCLSCKAFLYSQCIPVSSVSKTADMVNNNFLRTEWDSGD